MKEKQNVRTQNLSRIVLYNCTRNTSLIAFKLRIGQQNRRAIAFQLSIVYMLRHTEIILECTLRLTKSLPKESAYAQIIDSSHLQWCSHMKSRAYEGKFRATEQQPVSSFHKLQFHP